MFGAAAAAGSILGLTSDQIVSAFGLCGSQAAGSMQFLVDGAWNKPFHVGYAAMGGLVSAVMSSKGFIGTKESLEGSKGGFLKAYAPDADPSEVVAGLGEAYETMNIAVKPYPSCRYGHAAIDALIAIKAANDVDYRAVEAIEVGLPQTGWNLIGDSFEQMVVDPKGEPNNFLSDAEMRGKFDTLAAPYLDLESLDHLAMGVLELDGQKNIHRLLDLTRPQSTAALKAV